MIKEGVLIMLTQLLYCSSAGKQRMNLAEEIVKFAENNSKKDITGALVFTSNYFLQALEGEREIVSNLYRDIVQDLRHDKCLLLHFSKITERDFSEWSMKLLSSKMCEKYALKFSDSADFNPYRMTQNQALGLLKACVN